MLHTTCAYVYGCMSPNLRDFLNSYKYEQSQYGATIIKTTDASKIVKKSPAKKKEKSKRNTKICPPIAGADTRVDLKDLPLSIAPGLTVVFIGFNPGVESSKQQHHYAHPTNLFWKLFNALDILKAVLEIRNTSIKSHNTLLNEIYVNGKSQARAEHDFRLIGVGIGFTDLVLRCTKKALELSLQEKVENVPRLLNEFQISHAPFIVFIGKGIWEVVCKYLVTKHKLTAENFAWGKQNDPAILMQFYSFCPYLPRVYVFPNTSGLVALMKYSEKLQLWECLVADIRLIL